MEYLGYKQGDLPITEEVTSEILSLPMFAELTDDEITYVAESIKKFYG
jgi:dTDP-4-amino-4,6-dideoxygalactose transaminase